MTASLELTDRIALLRNRMRASANPVLLLHEDVADEIPERLTAVNRRFTRPAILTGFPGIRQLRMSHPRTVRTARESNWDHQPPMHASLSHL